MRRILILVLSISIFSSCSNLKSDDYNFSIKGTITGYNAGDVYLMNRDAGEWIKFDTAVSENGVFEFHGNIDLPEMYYIGLELDRYYAAVFVEQSDILFSTSFEDFKNPEVTGSISHETYNSFQEKSTRYDSQMREAWEKIKTAGNEGDDDAVKKWEKIFDDLDIEFKQYILDYALQNNSSTVSAYLVSTHSYYYDETDLEPVVMNFDPSIAESEYVKALSKKVETLKKVAIGQPAVDFTMNDLDGNPVTLSSLYGDYLLVDFWASWCGPCRQENPNVVAVYNDFKEKGFNILGVSFDSNIEKWTEAISADSLTWSHVGDLKGWGNAAGKLYAIGSIPSNVLLDQEGKIIAKNLRGEDLRLKMEELLSE